MLLDKGENILYLSHKIPEMDDLIQVFVETLDRCFENVCELDLIFHADKVLKFYKYFSIPLQLRFKMLFSIFN